jgi:uncharacterized protein
MFTYYRQLLQKVDSTVAQLEKLHETHLTCTAGCDECCNHELNVCPVEIAFIADTVKGMDADRQAEIERRLEDFRSGENDKCPLLHDGLCLVYEARPLICRTHGLALDLAEQDAPPRIELTCSLNYTDIAPVDLPPGEAIKQVVLSTILYHVNLPFAESLELDPADRIPLSELAHLL